MSDEWKKTRLEQHIELLTGYPFKSTEYTEDEDATRLLRGDNVIQGSIRWEGVKRWKNTMNREVQQYALLPGDFVIAMDRTWVKAGLKASPITDEDTPSFLVQRVARLRTKNSLHATFLPLLIRSHRFEQYVKGVQTETAVPHISPMQIKEFPVLLPPLPEQKAIADLLSTWDEAIEKIERLIRAKERNLKGQIQKIMGRQAIDKNGWPEVHLGELFTEITRKVGEKELTPYSISAGIGFVSQREKWGKDISGSQHKNYTHLKSGEFSYNKGNSKRYQQGCVYLLKEGEICVPNVFISFKPKTKNVVPEFFEHYFIADYHARELKRYITSGARSDGLLNLNKKDFFKIMVPCPTPDEQKAIAEALTALHEEIYLLKQMAEKYKEQKRGLMQKLLTGEWRMKDEIISKYRET